MIDLDDILPLLPAHMAVQRWYPDDAEPDDLRVVESERWTDGDPTQWWMLVEARRAGRSLGEFQLLVGARPANDAHDFLARRDTEILGVVPARDDDSGGVGWTVYDAVIDTELAIDLLDGIAPGHDVRSVRTMSAEQSNTSIVYDDHVILKLFRRIHRGSNPDVDAIERLAAQGFDHVPAQYGVLRRDDRDLAVARAFLTGASDGWHLAQTSLRILFDDHENAASSGGDFGPEAHRLGAITAGLHLALAKAFGTGEADLSAWVAGFRAQLDRVRDHVDADAVSTRYDEVASLASPGPSLRIHGDFHLGQTLRSDTGWFVIDFEGEPARPVAERQAPSSPLRDVAGMLRSFHYAAEVARWSHMGAFDVDDDEDSAEIRRLAGEWERRARTEFLAGYFDDPEIAEILPDDDATRRLLQAFELDKAVYEVAYEMGFRPAWAAIPLGAIERLLGGT